MTKSGRYNLKPDDKRLRTYWQTGYTDITPGAGLCGGASLYALDTLLDGLTNQGQDLYIGRCRVICEVREVHDQDLRRPTSFLPVVLLSNADISTHNSTVSYYNLDQILELMTAGDFEFIQLGDAKLNTVCGTWWHTVDTEEKEDRNCRLSFDITKAFRKVAKVFQRGFGASIYADVVLAYMGGNSTVTQRIHCCLQLEYALTEKNLV